MAKTGESQTGSVSFLSPCNSMPLVQRGLTIFKFKCP